LLGVASSLGASGESAECRKWLLALMRVERQMALRHRHTAGSLMASGNYGLNDV